jgi:hypothetical protein
MGCRILMIMLLKLSRTCGDHAMGLSRFRLAPHVRAYAQTSHPDTTSCAGIAHIITLNMVWYALVVLHLRSVVLDSYLQPRVRGLVHP